MIAYVVPYLNDYGGIQAFAKLSYRLLRKRFNIRLVEWCFYFPRPVIKRFLNILPFFYTSYLKSKIPNKKDLMLHKADLIHFWHPLSAVGFGDTNFIVSCHGKEILPENLEIYEKRALEKVFDKAKAIHVNSKFTRKLFSKHFPFISQKKITLVYPGVDFQSRLENLNKLGLRLGTLSRFAPRKNILNIIRALNILKEKYQLDFKYLLVGKGVEEKKILNQLKKVNFEWQYWKELSEREKINKFYSQIDIFVLPTLSLSNDVEGFGIVYLEANSFGVPVVASRVDGVKEAVKENISGLFTDPKNPEKIAQSIYQLSLLRGKYQQSTRKWAKNFSLGKIVAKFSKLYDKGN